MSQNSAKPADEQPELHDDFAKISNLLKVKSCKTLFLVADRVAYESSGAKQIVEDSLDWLQITTFSDFRPNPSLEALEAGLQEFQRRPADVILAIGGGTAIDLAKLIGFCSAQNATPLEVINAAPAKLVEGPPLIAVPTTSGTGSEATHFAVVYVEGKKHSVAHDFLLPTDAIVDPILTASLPATLTAETGLDALCQAIEARWSICSSEQSNRYADEAIELAWRHLFSAVNNPTAADRQAMCRASHLAGRAINLTKTTAPHAISYTITSQFGVPHGRAVALTLGPILAFSRELTKRDCNDPRGVEHVQNAIDTIVRLLGCQTAGEAAVEFQKVVESIDCPTRLSEIGVSTKAQLRQIVEQVNEQRLANNPRRLSSESLDSILKSIV